MASRKDEKARLRQEREERERAAAAKARRSRLLQLIGGIVVACAIIAGVAVAVSSSGGGDDGPDIDNDKLKGAAQTSGCVYRSFPDEGQNHESKKFTAADYKTNPPTSGNHAPDWYEDGIYAPGNAPEIGKQVHALEHGRIDVQYKPGTPETDVAKLEALLAESEGGYHMLLFQNETGMDAQVAATAWGQSVTCPRMSDDVFDVLRTFRTSYIDKGPEAVP